MKTTKAVVVLAAVLAGVLVAESAFAWHRGRVGVGLYFGVPIGGYYYGAPYYYPPYYPYYPPATMVVPSQPQTYIEQGAPQAAPQPAPAQNFWYYCPDSRAYYPYVRDCPAGWQRVSPQPQG